MIRKLFLLGLPLVLFTTQQVKAVEKDPRLEQIAREGKQDMERLRKEGVLPNEINKLEYFHNHQLTPKARADLMKFIESYMYIMEHNAMKVPDEYKLNGLDPLEDGKSIPDTRSGLKGVSYQVGPFMGSVYNKDPLRFKTIWSDASISLINDYKPDVALTITAQDLSSIGLVFEKVNLVTAVKGRSNPDALSYLYIYHSRKNPDVKVTFYVDYTDFPNNPPTTLTKFVSIQISKGDFMPMGYALLRTVYPR